MFRTVIALMVTTLLIGCVAQKQSGPSKGQPDTCPKSQYSDLIGANINTAILPLTLTYRVIYPEDAVSMEHMPERLNVTVSDKGTVQSLSCG